MKHLLTSIILITVSVLSVSAKGNRALDALMERISPGLSAKVTVRLTPGSQKTATRCQGKEKALRSAQTI